MPRVLMNFQLYNVGRPLHRGRCKTRIGRRDCFFHFPAEEDFRALVSRCNLEDVDKFNRGMAQRSRGSNYASLTEEQYRTLL